MTSDPTESTPRRPRATTTMLPAIASPSPHQLESPSGSSEHGPNGTSQEPLRHPKPLTPSDLHLMLEKEQESMVNRLTRELSALRQQTASVASTASSTSTLDQAADGPLGSPTFSNSTHSSRRQRSSSSLSSQNASIQHQSTASVTGIAPSRTADPSRPPFHIPHRTSVSQTHLGLSSNSPGRYEEVALHKAELEAARRENEQLRRRIRELELVLKKQKEDSMDPVDTQAG
ncbi:hypothetical protein N7468_006015 [Penicillium chermesinum]|uniref:Uncharacterized protein n=1 Tax=Penicillium chermesinum TaxID=63820 RepID=A0A9W9P038_9EURO|nr:uncharacterized protein N7468_006015 [Penicillium chermesinum]KAJ5233059.1 hypothetical protein N7468_006015 [Penicillium chermesinum]